MEALWYLRIRHTQNEKRIFHFIHVCYLKIEEVPMEAARDEMKEEI